MRDVLQHHHRDLLAQQRQRGRDLGADVGAADHHDVLGVLGVRADGVRVAQRAQVVDAVEVGAVEPTAGARWRRWRGAPCRRRAPRGWPAWPPWPRDRAWSRSCACAARCPSTRPCWPPAPTSPAARRRRRAGGHPLPAHAGQRRHDPRRRRGRRARRARSAAPTSPARSPPRSPPRARGARWSCRRTVRFSQLRQAGGRLLPGVLSEHGSRSTAATASARFEGAGPGRHAS